MLHPLTSLLHAYTSILNGAGPSPGTISASQCRRPGSLVLIIQRYVFKQLLVAILFSVGGILFVLVPALLVSTVHKIGAAGLGALTGYLPLVFADLVPYILPLGFLLAVVTTFGRLAADREWTAIRSAGINPAKLLTPCLLIAVVFVGATNWLAAELAPSWKLRQRTYRREALENAVKLLSPGRTDVQFPGFFLSAARRDPDRPVFYQAHISVLQHGDSEEDGKDLWMYADKVSFEFDGPLLVASFTDARAIQGGTEGGFENTSVIFDLDAMLDSKPYNPNRPKYLKSSEITRRLENNEVAEEEIGEYDYEVNRRRALSATYLLFLLLGIPTGIRLRSSTQLAAFGAAIAYAMVYYVLSLQLARQLFQSGALSGAVAPWIINIVGGVIGVIACARVIRK
ncbi:MAG: lipopolysaccharide export LptBFGC system permease protein LptF [Planctomycetota bacterium]